MGENLAGNNGNMFLLAAITIALGVFIHMVYKIVFGSKKKEALHSEAESDTGAPSEEALTENAVTESRISGKTKKRTTWKGKTEFNHPWLLKNLKGHPGTVLLVDFSANGKFMAATCDDGSVILWDIKDLNAKDHKNLRVNIEFDHASHVAWSPDSKAFIVHKVRDNNIVVYKIEKKKDGAIGSATPVITFDKVHEDDVIGFGISTNGKFMMSCSNKTDMVIWDLKGQQLTRLDTYLMSTHSAKISPCGRFVVASGFSPDIKVMEVCFNKNGDFKQVTKAYELTGHSSGIYDVAFDVDTSHIATISKDGTWKLYHTKINYAQGESPHVLETGLYTQTGNQPRIALSPDAEVLAVSVDNAVEFYDTYTGKLYDTVENIYSDGVIQTSPRDNTDIDSILLSYEHQQPDNFTTLPTLTAPTPPLPPPTPPSPPPAPPAPRTSQEEVDSVPLLDSFIEPGLDSEILEILGDDPTATIEYGKDIRAELAARFNHIATNGLNKDNRKELCDKYLIPGNCTLIGAPTLNAEVKIAVNENTLRRDRLIEARQKRIAAAISCIGEALSHALEAKEKDNTQIKRLMDTARLICDAQYNDSVSRRNLAVYSLKKEMKEPLLNTKIDKSLFGEHLTESLKAAKAVTKSGTELKTQFKPPAKNWKIPVAGRRQPATTRRNTPAAPTTPAQSAPPSPAEPRTARPNSWRRPPPPPPKFARRRY